MNGVVKKILLWHSKGVHFFLFNQVVWAFCPKSFWRALHDTLCFSKFLVDGGGLKQTCDGITSSPFFVRSRWTYGSLFLRVSPKWHQLQRHCWILSRPHICQSKQSPKSRASFTQDLRKLQNKRYTCSYFLDLPMYYFSIFSPGVELKSRGWGS